MASQMLKNKMRQIEDEYNTALIQLQKHRYKLESQERKRILEIKQCSKLFNKKNKTFKIIKQMQQKKNKKF